MWLQALFTKTDIIRVFSELTPVQLALDAHDPDRYLWLARPTSIELVDNESIRLVTSAKLQWDLAGLKVPITLRTISVRATPAIDNQDGHDVVTFGIQIEDADLSAVPGFIEAQLIARVNETLDARRAQIAWRFGETLNFHFRMPNMTQPRRDVHLYAHYGAVRLSEEGLVLAASFELDVQPRDAPAADPGPVDVHETAAPASAA